MQSYSREQLTAAQVQEWLKLAKQGPSQTIQTSKVDQRTYQRGIQVLEQIMQNLIPKETVLLAKLSEPIQPGDVDTVSVGSSS